LPTILSLVARTPSRTDEPALGWIKAPQRQQSIVTKPIVMNEFQQHLFARVPVSFATERGLYAPADDAYQTIGIARSVARKAAAWNRCAWEMSDWS
jgi:hypothetical protein